MCSVFQLLALTLTIFTQEKVDKKKEFCTYECEERVNDNIPFFGFWICKQ